MYRKLHNYPFGSVVQHRTGYTFIKTSAKGWVARHRFLMEQKLGQDLEKGVKVFHINGDRTDDRIDNLVPIKFNTKKFVFLPSSKVLYIPKRAVVKDRETELVGAKR